MKSFNQFLKEKTLTPAEKKKREEIAKAMERENPGMDMKKKMAIATWQAKKVAEAKAYVSSSSPKIGEKGSHDVIGKDGKVVKSFPYSKDGMKAAIKHLSRMKEETELEEGIENMPHGRLKWHMNSGVPHGRYSKDEMKAERDRRLKTGDAEAYKKAKPMLEKVELDEVSIEKLRDYTSAALQDKNKAKADKRWKYASKAMKTVGDREAKAAHALKYNKMEEAEQIDELSKKTLYSYAKKADQHSVDFNKVKTAKKTGGPEAAGKEMNKQIHKAKNRTIGVFKAMDKFSSKNEAVEELDEISKKTLGSYIKKAKDDLGNREAEVTRNRYVDPRGVKDPVKHNNALLMKRAKRRDNINKAVDKLTKEEVQSADKKVEKYIRPDGKVGIRMTKVDKEIIKKN